MSFRSLFEPFGEFVARTPLLPVDAFVSVSNPIGGDETDLTEFTENANATASLVAEQFASGALRSALAVAAPGALKALADWESAGHEDPGAELPSGLARTLISYLSRAATRATPFGLFATLDVGTVGPETNLRTSSTGGIRCVSFLDPRLAHHTEVEFAGSAEGVSQRFTVTPLRYRLGAFVRFLSGRGELRDRQDFDVASVEASAAIELVLASLKGRSEALASLEARLVAAIPDAEAEEVAVFVRELVELGLLVPPSPVSVLRAGPEQGWFVQAPRSPAGSAMVSFCAAARSQLGAAGAERLCVPSPAVTEAHNSIVSEGLRPDASPVFVDAFRDANPTLSGQDLETLGPVVDFLHQHFGFERGTGIRRFSEQFKARYGEAAEVPLLAAVDPEMGIPFDYLDGADSEPLLAVVPRADGRREASRPRLAASTLGLAELLRAWDPRSPSIELRATDVLFEREDAPPPLPDVLRLQLTPLLEGEQLRWCLQSVSGPDAGDIFGRFTPFDDRLATLTTQIADAEESLSPDKIFAELEYVGDWRMAHLAVRRRVRRRTISLVSSLEREPGQLSLQDLSLSLEAGRLVLRDGESGSEVVPTFLSAFNAETYGIGVFRLLAALRFQGRSSATFWSWGQLAECAALPRVSVDGVVVSPRRWRLKVHELGHGSDLARFNALGELRRAHNVDRWVQFSEGDRVLTVDLCDPLQATALLHRARSNAVLPLSECLVPHEKHAFSDGTANKYATEVIVPYRRKDPPGASRGIQEGSAAYEAILPFHGALYVKLYLHQGCASEVLSDVVGPWSSSAMTSGRISHWFFIRYGDPYFHLRLRAFCDLGQGPDPSVLLDLIERLSAWREPQRLWRLTVDTYEPEVARYGGADSIRDAERVFHHDSEWVLRAMREEPQADGWLRSASAVVASLDAMGFAAEAKLALLTDLCSAGSNEVGGRGARVRALGKLYRAHRGALDRAVVAVPEEVLGDEYAEALRRYSSTLASTNERIRARAASSVIHMHTNRYFSIAAGHQEFVVYDLARRALRSTLARRRAADE